MRDQCAKRPILWRLSFYPFRSPIRDLAAALRVNLRAERGWIGSGRVLFYRWVVALLDLLLGKGLAAEQTLRLFEQVLLGPFIELFEVLEHLRIAAKLERLARGRGILVKVPRREGCDDCFGGWEKRDLRSVAAQCAKFPATLGDGLLGENVRSEHC